MNKDTVGMILAGGKSSRMGQDKSIKRINGKNLIELVFRRSEKQVSEIIINSNLAREHFQNLNYNALLSDCIPGSLGPMAGILTGIKWVRKNTKKKWLVCFPVDSPFFPKNLVMEFLLESKGQQVVLAESLGRLHPVFSMWNIGFELESKIEHLLKNGERKIDKISKKFKTRVVNFPDIGYDPFFNINTPEDLETANRIEKEFEIN